jgi:hypothetical protein
MSGKIKNEDVRNKLNIYSENGWTENYREKWLTNVQRRDNSAVKAWHFGTYQRDTDTHTHTSKPLISGYEITADFDLNRGEQENKIKTMLCQTLKMIHFNHVKKSSVPTLGKKWQVKAQLSLCFFLTEHHTMKARSWPRH